MGVALGVTHRIRGDEALQRPVMDVIAGPDELIAPVAVFDLHDVEVVGLDPVMSAHVLLVHALAHTVDSPVFAVDEDDDWTVGLRVQVHALHQVSHEGVAEDGRPPIVPRVAQLEGVVRRVRQAGEKGVVDVPFPVAVAGDDVEALARITPRPAAADLDACVQAEGRRAVCFDPFHVHRSLPILPEIRAPIRHPRRIGLRAEHVDAGVVVK